MEFAKVEITPEGVFSPAFGDWYFSVPDGVAESRYVYFDANDVVAGYAQAAGGAGAAGFTVAELGFGTGLNCAITLQGILPLIADHLPFRYIAIEQYPITQSDMLQAASLFAGADPGLLDCWRQLAVPLDGGTRHVWEPYAGVSVELCVGPAQDWLPQLDFKADVWYLDGFSPACNPAMWQLELLQQVTRLSKPGARCSSFTAAGWVRRALADCGWTVKRRPGFGRKRHMTVGQLAG